MRAFRSAATSARPRSSRFSTRPAAARCAITIEGRPAPAGGEEPSAMLTIATPGYFPAMRIPLLDGRMLSDHDDADSARVALVSRAFARATLARRFAGGSAPAIRLLGARDCRRDRGRRRRRPSDRARRSRPPAVFLPHAQAAVVRDDVRGAHGDRSGAWLRGAAIADPCRVSRSAHVSHGRACRNSWLAR